MWWSPLALLFLERDLRRPSWRDFTLFCVCCWLQFLASTYLGLYLFTMAALRAGWAAATGTGALAMRPALGRLLALAAGTAAVLIPFVWPYLQVSRQWRYTRSLTENVSSSAELASYVSAAPTNSLYGQLLGGQPFFVWPKYFFPGFVAAIIALVGVAVVLRSRRREPDGRIRVAGPAYVAMGAVAFVLSLGPFLIWRGHLTDIPLPYLLLYSLAPGYQAMRVPARFGLWVGVAMAVLAGIGAHWLRQWCRERWGHRGLAGAAVAAGLVMALAGAEAYTPVRPVRVDVPPVYGFLASEDRGPLIELPMPRTLGPHEVHRREMERTFFSIYHGRPMVNGYSGFTPPWFDQIAAVANLGPRPDVIRALGSLGVRTIVVHLDEMSVPERQAWQAAGLPDLGVRDVARFGGDRVLRIDTALPAAAAWSADVDLPGIVAIGEPVRLTVTLASATDGPWVHRTLEPWMDIDLRWRDAGGCDALRSRVSAPLPVVLLPRDARVQSLDILAPTPGRAGVYRVAIESPWFSTSRRVTATEVFPAPSSRAARAGPADPPRRLAVEPPRPHDGPAPESSRWRPPGLAGRGVARSTARDPGDARTCAGGAEGRG
jgi:hypothetical protein